MAVATVVKGYAENGFACLEVIVDEGGKDAFGRTAHHVYTGRVPIDKDWLAMDASQQMKALVAAAKAVRDAGIAPVAVDLKLSGQVTL